MKFWWMNILRGCSLRLYNFKICCILIIALASCYLHISLTGQKIFMIWIILSYFLMSLYLHPRVNNILLVLLLEVHLVGRPLAAWVEEENLLQLASHNNFHFLWRKDKRLNVGLLLWGAKSEILKIKTVCQVDKCSYRSINVKLPTLYEIMTEKQTHWPTDRRTDQVIRKFNFQYYKIMPRKLRANQRCFLNLCLFLKGQVNFLKHCLLVVCLSLNNRFQTKKCIYMPVPA